MVHMLSRFSKSNYYHRIYSVSVNCTSLVGKTEGPYLWRELQKACQQVQPPSMGHPNNNIRYPAVSCHFQQLVEKAHHAFCSFSSVSLHCGKLGGQKVVKLLWNTMSDNSYRRADYMGQSQTHLRRPHTASSRVYSVQTPEMNRSHSEPGKKALPRTPGSSGDTEKTTQVVEELTPVGIPSECQAFSRTWVLVQGSIVFHLGHKLAIHPHTLLGAGVFSYW